MFKHLRALTQLNEEKLSEATLSAGFFQEAKGYSDPGDFTDEFYDQITVATKMKKIMKNPKWLSYMQALDRNSGTTMEQYGRQAIKAITDLEDALSDIDDQIDTINGLDAPPHDDVDLGNDSDKPPAPELDDEDEDQ